MSENVNDFNSELKRVGHSKHKNYNSLEYTINVEYTIEMKLDDNTDLDYDILPKVNSLLMTEKGREGLKKLIDDSVVERINNIDLDYYVLSDIEDNISELNKRFRNDQFNDLGI